MVISAPIAHIKVVAVKKLVVELQTWLDSLFNGMYCLAGPYFLVSQHALYWCVSENQDFYLKKIRVFKAGLCLNILVVTYIVVTTDLVTTDLVTTK